MARLAGAVALVLTLGTVRPAAAQESEPSIPDVITAAAHRYGLDPVRMQRLAWCESTWRARAISPTGYLGLFQFSAQTWHWASAAAGVGEYSPLDAYANAEAAAWLLATEGPRHWSCHY